MVRILLVDDNQPFRKFLFTELHKKADLQVIAESGDGLDAVQKAQELQPDVILLDIGIPSLNGIEAARRIRKTAPHSKIVFVSQESSPDIVEEAMSTGAAGYIVKANAGGELMAALDIAPRGGTFLGGSFTSVRTRQRL
jgi:DNA-binding NarL/FixJ family response regulator